MITSLLPCPFCGSEAHASGCFADGHYQVICTECRAIIKADREDKVQGMWNQRVGRDPILQVPHIVNAVHLIEAQLGDDQGADYPAMNENKRFLNEIRYKLLECIPMGMYQPVPPL